MSWTSCGARSRTINEVVVSGAHQEQRQHQQHQQQHRAPAYEAGSTHGRFHAAF
jgi:hypothetical protein